MEKIFIWYAWAVWCWKSPITNYISTDLWLPIFNTDAIRSEVCEDLWAFDEIEAKERMRKRLNMIIQKWISFICDASVDRTWEQLKTILIKNNYKYFIISIDLSKDTLFKFYKAKSYNEALIRIDKTVEEHNNFLKICWDDVNLHINEENYSKRLDIAEVKVRERLKGNM